MGELDSTYGVLLIGVLISSVLFGVTNLQTFIYFQQYSSDIIWNKLAICWLWLLDVLHLVFCAHAVYHYLITDFLNPVALLEVVWSFKAQVMDMVVVMATVHTLYTIRIWKLTRLVESERPLVRTALPMFVTVIVVLAYATAFVVFYEITRYYEWTILITQKWLIYFPLGTATGVDVVIAASLCYLLARCRTGFHSMDSTITLLMIYTVNTGVVTIFCSIISMASLAALPQSFAMICVEFVITKLYVNCFMAMFNARNTLRSPTPASTADNVLFSPIMSDISGDSSNGQLHSFLPPAGRRRIRLSTHREPPTPLVVLPSTVQRSRRKSTIRLHAESDMAFTMDDAARQKYDRAIGDTLSDASVLDVSLAISGEPSRTDFAVGTHPWAWKDS